MKKNSSKVEVEHKLLPRLKLLAFVLIFFGLGTLIYGLATSAAPLVESTAPFAREKTEILKVDESNIVPELQREIIYLGVSAFWAIGASLLIYAWRRRMKLKIRLE